MFIMNFQRIIAYKKIYSNTKFLWTGHSFKPTYILYKIKKTSVMDVFFIWWKQQGSNL